MQQINCINYIRHTCTTNARPTEKQKRFQERSYNSTSPPFHTHPSYRTAPNYINISTKFVDYSLLHNIIIVRKTLPSTKYSKFIQLLQPVQINILFRSQSRYISVFIRVLTLQIFPIKKIKLNIIIIHQTSKIF